MALAIAGENPPAELFSLDAMAVYRGMDVGTSKPSPAELRDVVCRGVDLVEPTQEFAVPDLMAVLRPALAEAGRRRTLVVAVGGTGLYVRALLDGLDFPGRFPDVRARLEAVPDTSVLYGRLRQTDPVAASKILPGNRRRVLRALEVCEGSGRVFSSYGPGLDHYPRCDFIQVGLRMPRSVLDARIARRFKDQLEAGFVDEVKRLADAPGQLSRTARQALGYKELLEFLAGECSLDDAQSTAVRRIVRFARRQDRWFRRDPRIRWITIEEDPLEALPDIQGIIDQCI